MTKITTATGRTFDSDYFVELKSQSILFLRVLNTDQSIVNNVFQNANETSCLACANRTAFGYINLNSILKEGDAFKVVLSK